MAGAVGRDVKSVLITAAAVFVAGCGPLAIDYRPSATASPAPTASVALHVSNDRDEDHGGRTERIGTIYSSSGGIYPGPRNYSGRPVNATSAETVTGTVGAATTDALAHAGVSVRTGSPTLIASVREYWMDGPNVKHGVIVVAYDLFDRGGRRVWHTDARGEASVIATVGNGLVRMFRAALQDLAEHANTAFRSPEFQAALRQSS